MSQILYLTLNKQRVKVTPKLFELVGVIIPI